jgi:hypothetical protein
MVNSVVSNGQEMKVHYQSLVVCMVDNFHQNELYSKILLALTLMTYSYDEILLDINN